MLDYLTHFFSEGSAVEIIARYVLVLLASVMYFVVFHYAKKRNLNFLTYVIIFALVIVFALSFVKVDGFAFIVYFVLLVSAIASLLFFAQDFRRDMFRYTWGKIVGNFAVDDELGREDLHSAVDSIVKACQRMSKNDTGALIVIADNISDAILESGTKIDAVVTTDLLETIFFDKTPLHDGAVIIRANKVLAASCYLPLTQDLNLPREFGTRHRAAIGITESNPSLTAIVVSEESGVISAMHDGHIKRYLDAEKLKRILECALRLSDSDEEVSIWGLSENEEE